MQTLIWLSRGYSPILTWVSREGPVSVISICLPNAPHLVKRARNHGLKALFNRRTYAAASPRPSDLSPTHARLCIKIGRFERIGSSDKEMQGTNGVAVNRGSISGVSMTTSDQGGSEKPLELTKIYMHYDMGMSTDLK